MRKAFSLALLSAWGTLSPPVFGLTYSVTNFRADLSGNPSDTSKLDPAFGDSLYIATQSFQFKHVLTQLLDDGLGLNGAAGASPVVSVASDRVFRVAYVGWPTAHLTQNGGSFTPSPADILSRTFTLRDDTTSVDARLMVTAQENPADTANPRRFYGGLTGPGGTPLRPPPSYLNFFAGDSNYAAYWGTYSIRGSVRRTSDLDRSQSGDSTGWSRYVPPANPMRCDALGKIGAAAQPGSRARKTVLAYEDTISGPNYNAQVRFENLAAGTSQAVNLVRPELPEDFAVAVDSVGITLVLWRQANVLYMSGYDSNRVEIRAPMIVQSNIGYKDSVTEHTYRPYGATAIYNGRFVITYIAASGVAAYRIVDLPLGSKPFSMGFENAVGGATPGQPVYFPSVCSENGRVAFTWFQRAGSGNTRVMTSLWLVQSSLPDPTTRVDLDGAADSVGFGAVGTAWYPWHYFKTPNCALDATGDLVIAYDNGFHAKAAVVKNAPVHYDSALFVSRSLRLGNGSLAFLPGSDSAEFRGVDIVGDTAGVAVTVASANDSAFTTGVTSYRTPGAGIRTAQPYYRYRVSLKTRDPQKISTPHVDAVTLRINARPRIPSLDSVRVGAAALKAYDSANAPLAYKRLDSLAVALTAFDLDDEDSLRFTVRLGNTVLGQKFCAAKAAAGFLHCSMTLSPLDTTASSVTLSLTAQDPQGWVSPARAIAIVLRNAAPTESLQVVRHHGLDSAGIFWPGLGMRDSLAMNFGATAWVHRGDTALLRVRTQDLNDPALTLRWFRNGLKLGEKIIATGTVQEIPILPLSPQGRPDTVRFDALDADTTVSFTVYLRANRVPTLDRIQVAGYQGKDSVWVRKTVDQITDFTADSGLVIPIGQPSLTLAFASDSDQGAGDSVHVAFQIPPSAPVPGDSLTHAFTLNQSRFRVRVTDNYGAFVEHGIQLEFPFLDTSNNASNRSALKTLAGGLDFILNAAPTETTLVLQVISAGTLPLQITSVQTLNEDHRWLEGKVQWVDTGATSPSKVAWGLRTDQNPLPSSGALLSPRTGMTLTLRLFTDSLNGDSVFFDTLVVRTNDLSTPEWRIPIRFQYRSLPVFSLQAQGSGLNPLTAFLPTHTTLRFAFSEQVRGPSDGSGLRIYSYRDSLADPKNYRDIPGIWKGRLRALPKASRVAMDSTVGWSDTLLFTPSYTQPSLSTGLKPPDGAFVHRDILHVRLSNSITDQSGNALNLRGDRVRLAPGTLDTVLALRIDTLALRVTRVDPAPGVGWNPDSSIRIRFNGPLRRRDSTSALGVDLGHLTQDSNSSVRVTSKLLGNASLGLRSLALANGDSTLILATRLRAAALDTVSVWLAASLADTSGTTLDGNGDGIPGYVYDFSDSADAFVFDVNASNSGFYTFPNPFNFSDARHLAKGSITFKNLHMLRGYQKDESVKLQVHTMGGDLVYASNANSNASVNAPGAGPSVSLDWNLRNDAGSTVGTGVYLYVLTQGPDRLLKKGKLAVVR